MCYRNNYGHGYYSSLQNLTPDGYYTTCIMNRVYVIPYSRDFNPITQKYHLTAIGPYRETGESCTM